MLTLLTALSFSNRSKDSAGEEGIFFMGAMTLGGVWVEWLELRGCDGEGENYATRNLNTVFPPNVTFSHYRTVAAIASCFGYILGFKGATYHGAVVAASRRPCAARGDDVNISLRFAA